MLAELTAEQVAEWAEYHQLEPWGEERADLRCGIQASVTANVWRGKGRAAKPSDFMPKFGPSKPQSWEDMKFKMQAWAAAVNANIPG